MRHFLNIFLLAISFATILVSTKASVLSHPSATQNEQLRLIRVSATEEPKWLSQDQIFGLIRKGIHFMDVTDHPSQPTQRKIDSKFAFPEELQFQANVQAAFSKLNISRVENFFNHYTTYHNRYYNTELGAEASEWLFSQVIEAYINNNEYPGSVGLSHVPHDAWLQKSIVARIDGSDETLSKEIVIIGGHLDSINNADGPNGLAPGADDNASGSAVVLEAFNAILASGFIPKRTVEFHWYAAEEVGLRGSQEIAALYQSLEINVVTMINFDVVGYYKDVRSIGISSNEETDGELNQFLKTVIDGYLDYTWIERTCPFGCSDHASWNKFGYPAAFPRQAVSNPYMHTPQDALSIVSFEQVIEFVKLAVGAVIEIAEPSA